MSVPPFWGSVRMKKWPPFLVSGTVSPTFWYLKLDTFGTMAHFYVPKNGTSGA